ncbi:hypothetical protein ACVV2G_25410 [Streptomyces ziwulingensis]
MNRFLARRSSLTSRTYWWLSALATFVPTKALIIYSPQEGPSRSRGRGSRPRRPPRAPAAAPVAVPEKDPASANGWTLEKEANHVSAVWTRPVPGTGLEVDVRTGDVQATLLHVVRRFHYEVERLPRPGSGASGSLFPLRVRTVRDEGAAGELRPAAPALGGGPLGPPPTAGVRVLWPSARPGLTLQLPLMCNSLTLAASVGDT